jgi:hypothetical protein
MLKQAEQVFLRRLRVKTGQIQPFSCTPYDLTPSYAEIDAQNPASAAPCIRFFPNPRQVKPTRDLVAVLRRTLVLPQTTPATSSPAEQGRSKPRRRGAFLGMARLYRMKGIQGHRGRSPSGTAVRIAVAELGWVHARISANTA